MDMLVRHYGASKYLPDKFATPRNTMFWRNKPTGGLWTSPVNSEHSWKQWCIDNDFRKCTDYFDIKIEGNIVVINSIKDLEKLPWQPRRAVLEPLINFEKLALIYDAVHLTAKGEAATRWMGEYSMYGWDCESVLILNKKIIK